MLYQDLWTERKWKFTFFKEGDIVSDLLSNGPWPLAVEEHLAIKYRFDQIKIGEFVGFCAGLPTNKNLEVSLWQD